MRNFSLEMERFSDLFASLATYTVADMFMAIHYLFWSCFIKLEIEVTFICSHDLWTWFKFRGRVAAKNSRFGRRFFISNKAIYLEFIEIYSNVCLEERNLSNYSDFGNNEPQNAKAIEEVAWFQLHFSNAQSLLLILITKTHFHRDKPKRNCSNLKHKQRSSQSFSNIHVAFRLLELLRLHVVL